jgi:hypothetical protein
VSRVRLNPDLPAKIAEIISKCLEKDRNLRQHSSDLSADLKRLRRQLEFGESLAVSAGEQRFQLQLG